MGIKETKELLAVGFDFQDAFLTANEDGKITIADIPAFFPLFNSGRSGIGGINKVGAELLDLDEAENQELIDFAREKFDLPDDLLEILIEDTLEWVLNGVKLANRWADQRK